MVYALSYNVEKQSTHETMGVGGEEVFLVLYILEMA